MPTGGTTPLGFALLVLLVLLVGLPLVFQRTWNSTMPAIFNLKSITYDQAFRLLILAWILFGVLRLGT